jgi:hypothetical protein
MQKECEFECFVLSVTPDVVCHIFSVKVANKKYKKIVSEGSNLKFSNFS